MNITGNATGSTKLAGVVGWPIDHSLSPKLHGFWIGEYQLDAAYIPMAVRREDFSSVINGLRLAGFEGVNVTVPHKEAAFAMADYHNATAEITGAANLLLFRKNGIEANNTDQAGLASTLIENLGNEAIKGRPVAIWGAGGMARAAVCALSDLGAQEIRILNRDKTRAASLVAALAPKTAASLSPMGFDDWEKAGRDASLLVNATSAGMKGTASIDLPLDVLPDTTAVFDAVYNPLETPLLRRAKSRGLRTVDGLGMLMHQAVPSFAAFFGIEPKVTKALRGAMEEALRHGR